MPTIRLNGMDFSVLIYPASVWTLGPYDTGATASLGNTPLQQWPHSHTPAILTYSFIIGTIGRGLSHTCLRSMICSLDASMERPHSGHTFGVHSMTVLGNVVCSFVHALADRHWIFCLRDCVLLNPIESLDVGRLLFSLVIFGLAIAFTPYFFSISSSRCCNLQISMAFWNTSFFRWLIASCFSSACRRSS